MAAPVTFKNDIMPIFYQYRGAMAWRFDLTSYENVKTNAQLILNQIAPASGPPSMPPYPYPPLSDQEIALFKTWIAQGCPEG